MRRREDMLTTLVDADDLVDPEAQVFTLLFIGSCCL